MEDEAGGLVTLQTAAELLLLGRLGDRPGPVPHPPGAGAPPPLSGRRQRAPAGRGVRMHPLAILIA